MQAVIYQASDLARPNKPPPTPRYAEAARLLRAAIEGESQHKAAARLEVTQGYVYRLLAGYARPSPALIDRIAHHYGADRAALMRAAGHTEPAREVREARASYDPILEEIDVRRFRGAEDLPAGDADRINQTIRDLLSAARRREGREP